MRHLLLHPQTAVRKTMSRRWVGGGGGTKMETFFDSFSVGNTHNHTQKKTEAAWRVNKRRFHARMAEPDGDRQPANTQTFSQFHDKLGPWLVTPRQTVIAKGIGDGRKKKKHLRRRLQSLLCRIAAEKHSWRISRLSHRHPVSAALSLR